ncbi:MAG: TATA-box-binding protein [Candidatus Nitrosomaritimum aestuariumsis]|jgi:transcription initiation factor TFIID TATA-box-binding protein|nr:TATA box-binding protein [Nitrosopumilaceae archaeon]
MAQTKPVIEIVNVVASATIEQKLDLLEVTKKFPDVEYHPEQFPGAVFRLKDPLSATLLFNSGKMVCTGAKSEKMSIKAVNTVVQKLRKGKIKIKNEPIVTIQNIVSSINLGGTVSLEQAARTLPRSMYEPEQFPGLIHRMLDPRTVILIFASGKLVCVGAKVEEEIHRSVNQIHNLLEEKGLMTYD